MGFKQASLCLLVAVAVTADYQGPSDYNRPQTSYGTPAPWYGAPGGNRGSGGGQGDGGYGGDERPKSYQFGYAVRDYASGNDFGRHETSDGDTVTGQYRVQLPDGRTQIVTYTADWKNGFQADVKYEGEAFFPDKQSNYGNNNQQHGGSSFGSSGHHGSSFGSSGNHGSSFGSSGNHVSSFGSSGNHGSSFGSSGNHGSSFGSSGHSDNNYGSSGHNDNNYGSYRRGGSSFRDDSYSNHGSNSRGYSQNPDGYGK